MYTINELAEALGVDYTDAAGLYRFLRVKGLVKEVGTRRSKSGKGKPSQVFTIPDRIVLEIPIRKALVGGNFNASNNFGAADSAEDMRKEDALCCGA